MESTTNSLPVNLAKALLAAQKEITAVLKTADNPYFKSKYADRSAVIHHVKPILNKYGIAFIQMPVPASREGYAALATTLLHESGESVSGTAEAPLAKSDPQAYGSAITYLSRYALVQATGLMLDAEEDDDGNAASDKGLQRPQGTLAPKTPAAPVKKKASLFPVPKGASNGPA